MYLHQLVKVSMENVEFDDTATTITDYEDSKGGAIYGSCISDEIHIHNMDVHESTSVIGGAVFLYECESVQFSETDFRNNSAILAGGAVAIFTPGTGNRYIGINDTKFVENGGAALGSTVYIGSYRDIVMMFDGSESLEDGELWVDVADDLYALKRKLTKDVSTEFTFRSDKFDDITLSAARILVDIEIDDDDHRWIASPHGMWREDDAYLYDASGTLQAQLDHERSFGNVLFLEDAYIEGDELIGLDVGTDYTFQLNGM